MNVKKIDRSRKFGENSYSALFSEIANQLSEMSNGKIVLLSDKDFKQISFFESIINVLMFPINKAEDIMKIREKSRIMLNGSATEKKIGKIILCISELTTNVLKHAKKGNYELLLEKDKRILVWVSDKGNGINIDLLERAFFEKGFSTKKSLGYGMKIILSYSDKIYINTDNTGTSIVLEFLL